MGSSTHRPVAVTERHFRSRWLTGASMLSVGGLLMGVLAACGSSSTGASSSPSSPAASASSSSSSASKSPYTIHAILSLTGGASFLGDEEEVALKALESQVNSTGGIDGHPLSFVFSDNQTNASTSVSLASPLISQVPVLIVGSLTTTDRPVDSLATSSGPVIYDLSPGDHPAKGSTVYSSSQSTVSQTQAFINFVKSKGWTRVAAITSTDASGQDGWTNLDAAAKATNGAVQIIDHETFAPTAVSVTTQLAKIKALNPQALFIWTTGTPVGTVFKGMQELGMGSMPTLTTDGNQAYKEMLSLSSELPSQLYFPSPAFGALSSLTGSLKTAVTQFDSAMKAAGTPVPDAGDGLAWDPGLILVTALRHLGVTATAAQINSYIQSLSSFAGASGTYNFVNPPTPSNRGIGINSIYVVEWNAAKKNWVPVSGPAGNKA